MEVVGMSETLANQSRQERPRPWLAAYAEGVPADIESPRLCLTELFEQAVNTHSDRLALDFLGATMTYRELGDRVDHAAEALRTLGVGPGDRVALVLPNCPQHVIAFYAILRLGAVVVEHNPLYTRDELAVQFADHGAAVAICWSSVAPVVASLGVPTVLSVDLSAAMPIRSRVLLRLPLAQARAAAAALGPRKAPKGTLSWEHLVAGVPRLQHGHPQPSVADIALIQYTGGTTGAPKGAMLSHSNLAANAAQGRAWVPQLKDGEETILGVLPFFHAYGLTLCLTFAINLGAQLVMLPRFEVNQALDTIRRVRPTFLPGVPPIYERLAASAPGRGVDLSSIRVGLSGAMPLPTHLVDTWEALTGGLLVEGYGMTETSPITLGNPTSPQRRPGTVGVPFPSTMMRVVDQNDPTRDVVDGDPGELLVQGPQVFAGYWRQPEETAAILLPGGWLRTGDIVVVDPEGYVRIVDRMKELIITGGFNVYPSEVEDVLRRHPDVADAAVVGLPGHEQGEIVAAAVIASPGAKPDPAALQRHCRAHLAGYKTPRRIDVVADLPRSQIGKVLRRDVKARLLTSGTG
jgi:long-chain acyl-CoA synthetase